MAAERKLVRARPKLPEYLPEWAKCCDWHERARNHNRRRLGDEFIVDISRKVAYPFKSCQGCGAPLPPIEAFLVIKKGLRNMYTAIDLLDLDETGIPNGNYVTADEGSFDGR